MSFFEAGVDDFEEHSKSLHFHLDSNTETGSTQLLQKFIDKLNQGIGPGRDANTTLQDHIKASAKST